MSKENKYKIVEDFIFDDNIQKILEKIKNSVMNFNILEITGMGSQEIKHSNILAWMFDDSEHNLEYKVLENFLKKVIEYNEEDQRISLLKHYIYLPDNKRNITIYREKDNIDLLIVDDSNNVVIAIENKIYASERIQGEDGGQLKKYVDIINNKYKNYNKHFIYLTIDESLSNIDENQKNWLCATHEMIGQVVEDIIKSQNISPKTEIIFSSYIDLLKRRNIMEDKKLEELCKKIWDKNSKALDIIYSYRTTKLDKLYDLIKNEYTFYDEEFYDITIDAVDRVYQYIYDKKWSDCNERAIDIQIKKTNNSIWIGYCHPEVPNTDNKVLKRLYKDIFNIQEKKQKVIVRIYESSLEKLNNDELNKKAEQIIDKLNSEIEDFTKRVNRCIC